jgi:hypothetical protein
MNGVYIHIIGNALYRESPAGPNGLACPSRRVPLTPHTVLRRTSCLPPGLALCTIEVRPPRYGIELRAGVKLRLNEHPLGDNK